MSIVAIAPGTIITFDYINYKGEKANRKTVFRFVQYGFNEYHPEKQLLLGCFCLDRNSYRSFAVKDISNLEILG